MVNIRKKGIAPMIKISSISFVALLVGIILLGFSTIYFPASNIINTTINIFAILLLFVGIILISSLIYDRYKDYKSEGDDHKKY